MYTHIHTHKYMLCMCVYKQYALTHVKLITGDINATTNPKATSEIDKVDFVVCVCVCVV